MNRGKSASQKTTKATPHIHEVKMPKIDVALQRGAKAVSRNLVESNTPFRVAMAQIRSNPADISGNTERIIGALYNAKASGANVVVFPEEAVSSYMSLDLRFYKSYVQQNLDGLERIRRATKDLPGLTAVVGFTDARLKQKHSGDRPKLWNSAAIIQDGKIEAVQDKSLHPNYNIFWDDRYFCPSRGSKIVKTNGRNIGVTICEDIWTDGYSSSPSNTLVKQGADLLLNLSASPWHIGKVPVREEVIRKVVNTHKVPMLYTNLVGCYDGYEGEVIFDGRSMFMTSRGQLGAMGKGFAEDLVIVDVNSQQRFTIPEIDDIEDLHNALVMGIRDYYHRLASKIGLNNAVIGLSGGIDSAIVAYLATEALGPDRIIGLTLPSGYSSEETQKDASDLANNLGISFFKSRSIESSFRTILKELNKDPQFRTKGEDVTEENIQARLRMIMLMAYANKFGGVVLGTGNKTEFALNNMTIYGDMIGGIGVLADLDKDRIYSLGEYINKRANREIIPIATLVRPPSAELKPNQTDAMVMGGEPQFLAPLVRDIIVRQLTYSEALAKHGKIYSEQQIRRVFTRNNSAEWKRRQAPDGFRVTPLAFGAGRRMPKIPEAWLE